MNSGKTSMTRLSNRLRDAIEGVLYRKGSAKKSTVQIEASRMAELRQAFEALQLKKELSIHQRWEPHNGRSKTRVIIELNETRVGYEFVSAGGKKLQHVCTREEWDEWVEKHQPCCVQLADYCA